MFSKDVLFQQDRALSHATHEIRSLSNDLFPNGWIWRYNPREWPAKSPDLTPPDFFL